MENPPPAPIRVIAIKPPSRAGWGLLLMIAFAGIGVCISLMLRPAIVEESDGVATVYRVDGDQLNMQILLLIVSGVCALAVLVHGPVGSRYRQLGGVGLTLCLVLPLAVWHHSAARIAITADSLTAPLKSRLFPGDAVKVRFDQMTMLRFSGERGGKAGRWQRCYTKDHREIAFDFAPLGDAVVERIVELAEGHGVKVKLP